MHNRHKTFLALAFIAGTVVLLLVYAKIKPVALRTTPSRAAASVDLSWVLLEPEVTVRTSIYRTTSGFLSDPVDQYKIADVTAPTTTYSDTNVSGGVTYYYSIFAVDTDGIYFDGAYTAQQPVVTSPPPPPINEILNINCSGTVFYVNPKGWKEGYPSADIFLLWNQSFSDVKAYTPEQCNSIPTGYLVYVPQGTLIKVAEGPTVWLVEGTSARPIASLAALFRISANPKIITVSIPYLHSHYSGGEIIQ